LAKNQNGDKTKISSAGNFFKSKVDRNKDRSPRTINSQAKDKQAE